MKDIILFGGWNTAKSSYQKLLQTAPGNCKIHHISYDAFIPNGNFKEFNKKVLEWIEKSGIVKFSIIGHSLGGALALDFISKNPERIDRLYLIDSAGIPSETSAIQGLLSLILAPDIVDIKEIKVSLNYHGLLRVLYHPLFSFKTGKFAHLVDLQREAKSLKVPTTILWGEKDRVESVWQARKLSQLIPNSKLIILAKVGHNWPFYAPELFWQNLR